MMDFLREWVMNIVILVIFIAFLDIILPNNKMKRYINMIIGLLIIIVLINPFINLIDNDININKEVFSNMIIAKENNNYDKKDIVNLQNQQVIDIYKNSLKKEIIDLLDSKIKYKISAIDLNIYEDQDGNNFGEIKSICLVIENKSNNDSSIYVDVKVDEVKKVGVNIDNESEIVKQEHLDKYANVRKILSESYRVPEEYVFVTEN